MSFGVHTGLMVLPLVMMATAFIIVACREVKVPRRQADIRWRRYRPEMVPRKPDKRNSLCYTRLRF